MPRPPPLLLDIGLASVKSPKCKIGAIAAEEVEAALQVTIECLGTNKVDDGWRSGSCPTPTRLRGGAARLERAPCEYLLLSGTVDNAAGRHR
jgi:hypothetical protein